jgi:hypothetical protein
MSANIRNRAQRAQVRFYGIYCSHVGNSPADVNKSNRLVRRRAGDPDKDVNFSPSNHPVIKRTHR